MSRVGATLSMNDTITSFSVTLPTASVTLNVYVPLSVTVCTSPVIHSFPLKNSTIPSLTLAVNVTSWLVHCVALPVISKFGATLSM